MIAPACSAGASTAVSYGSSGWRLAYRNCPDVARAVADILFGWPVAPVSLRHPGKLIATVVKRDDEYQWLGPQESMPHEWRRSPPCTPMEAVCDIHDVFFDWFLAENPDMLCLHGAAARIGAKLVLFPSVGKAGKSVLTAALAAAGHQVYCDDVLAIEPRKRRGVALGFAPRLRQPLPNGLSRNLTQFIEARTGFADRKWRYLSLRRGEIAPLGQKAEIGAIVLLDRRPSGRARLRQAEAGCVLRELILQNFATTPPPLAIFERLHGICMNARQHVLTYSRPEAAVDLLGRELE